MKTFYTLMHTLNISEQGRDKNQTKLSVLLNYTNSVMSSMLHRFCYSIFVRLHSKESSPPTLCGRYNPIPTRFLAPIDCSKIPAQIALSFPLVAENLVKKLCPQQKGTPSKGWHKFLLKENGAELRQNLWKNTINIFGLSYFCFFVLFILWLGLRGPPKQMKIAYKWYGWISLSKILNIKFLKKLCNFAA
jgi:hypothetical protein